ncbi:hypothetical protein KGF54_004143 [Candida jiufengensis]|uniref:uncharacterized protein n=1 Tax=Candida jiufengensis TaxID=497108 RepID=UPI00222592D9|nr:uncharacterized protein KGF54_004143 [Candida jiufengensis]KAI5951069.1 hypothetical protein KGF54_004143 [Candida jiufengensis]
MIINYKKISSFFENNHLTSSSGMDNFQFHLPSSLIHYNNIGAIINPRFNTKEMINKTNIEEIEQFNTDQKVADYLRPKLKVKTGYVDDETHSSGAKDDLRKAHFSIGTRERESIFAAELDKFFKEEDGEPFNEDVNNNTLQQPKQSLFRKIKSCSDIREIEKEREILGHFLNYNKRCHSEIFQESVHEKETPKSSFIKNHQIIGLNQNQIPNHNAIHLIPSSCFGTPRMSMKTIISASEGKYHNEKIWKPEQILENNNDSLSIQEVSIRDKILQKCSTKKLRVCNHASGDFSNSETDYEESHYNFTTSEYDNEETHFDIVGVKSVTSSSKKRRFTESPNQPQISPQHKLIQFHKSGVNRNNSNNSNQQSIAHRHSYDDDIVSFVIAKNKLLAEDGGTDIDLSKIGSLNMDQNVGKNKREKHHSAKFSGLFRHFINNDVDSNFAISLPTSITSSPRSTQSSKNFDNSVSTYNDKDQFSSITSLKAHDTPISKNQETFHNTSPHQNLNIRTSINLKETGVRSPFQKQMSKFIKKSSILLKGITDSGVTKDDIHFNFGPILKPELIHKNEFQETPRSMKAFCDYSPEELSNHPLELNSTLDMDKNHFFKNRINRKNSFDSFLNSHTATDTVKFFKEYIDTVL